MSKLINLNAAQVNVSFAGTALLQDWSLSPDAITLTYYQGATMPSGINVVTKFKDVYGTSLAAPYTALKYRTFTWNSHSVNAVVMSGPLFTGSTGLQDITGTGITGTMNYAFQNLNVLPVGVYTFKTEHIIFGINSFGAFETISQKTLVITVNVLAAGSPSISPLSAIITKVIGSGTASLLDFDVNGANGWTVEAPESCHFLPVMGVTIAPTASGGESASGYGAKTITLSIGPEIVPNPVVVNQMEINLKLLPGGQLIPITILLAGSSGLYQSVTSLLYEVEKGVNEAAPQQVNINYGSAYHFICPPWVTALPAGGTGSLAAYFSVLPTASIAAGEYAGQIEIRKDSDNSLLGVIAVQYIIHDRLRNPYNNQLGFTLEDKRFAFSAGDDDTYFELELQTRAYDYDVQGNSYKDYSNKFKIPLYKRSQTFAIGPVVDRLMGRLREFATDVLYPYNYAQVKAIVTRRKLSDASYSDVSAIDIEFIAGPRPDEVINDNCFLDINSGASRVTKNSYTYVNMNIAGSVVSIYKNGELVATKYYNDGIVTQYFSFGTCNPGDVVEFKIDTDGDILAKKYLVFPEGRRSFMVLWENEFKLRQVMEFTGDKTLKADLENRTQLLADERTDVLTKIESIKTNTLTINTGFILKSDIAAIESLCRSKRAAIQLPTGQVIDLVATQKTITTVDDNAALIAFDIEFQINRKSNEEVYTF